jgi:protein subunit release factor A
MIEPKDVDVRVIDQRIGQGECLHLGGFDTVVRVLHKPTGILVEVPRLTQGMYYDREVAFNMIESALTHPKLQKEPPIE